MTKHGRPAPDTAAPMTRNENHVVTLVRAYSVRISIAVEEDAEPRQHDHQDEIRADEEHEGAVVEEAERSRWSSPQDRPRRPRAAPGW